MNIHPIILCGGSGTRLWPLSRECAPKQFLPLLRGETPFMATLRRLPAAIGKRPPLVVTNAEYADTVRKQLHDAGITGGELLLEPFGRGTAPAIAIAAHLLLRRDPQAALLILPADHDIPDVVTFARAVATGDAALADERLVVFGLPVLRPETGFGYIEPGTPIANAPGCFAVSRFIEKPEYEIACSLASSGHHFWNSGIFLFPAARFLSEFARLEPELATACVVAADAVTTHGQLLHLDAATFGACRSTSVDHSVLEKTDMAAMVAANFAWSDIGSWRALWEAAERDDSGNATNGDVLLHGVANSYIHASRRMVVAVGIKKVVVIETADAVLVAGMDEVQRVGEVASQLRELARDEGRVHRRVERPWGHYEDIDSGDRFRVKRITVHPGGRLSLQLHHHRAEHWVVVRGTARVTCNEKEFLLHENESTFIPIGSTHRLENPGKISLEVIETQSGAYLREDDIVRLDDAYARA